MVIASTHVSGPQQIAFDAVGRHAIRADHGFHDGQYYGKGSPASGLAIARMLAHITYLSEKSMENKFGRTLRTSDAFHYDFDSEFSVETYLDYQGQQFVNRFDANSYLYVTKAIDYFDISERYGSLNDAMAAIDARMLVLSYSSDWLYPPYLSEQITYALARQKKDVTYCNVQSDYGHDAFLLEVDVMRKIIAGFLEHTADPDKVRRHHQDVAFSDAEDGPPPASEDSIYEGHRVDYDMIVDLVEQGSRVLDIGCGDGELLSRLIANKDVRGMGLDLAQGNVVSCVRRGISVVQADIDQGLSALPDQSFDYVILSMTLQVIEKPALALREMLRVGRKCIISFPNFGYWKVRLMAGLGGRAPVTRNLPYAWHETPNRYVLSIKDFRIFCEQLGVTIEREIPLYSKGVARTWPNIFAEEALYVVSGGDRV